MFLFLFGFPNARKLFSNLYLVYFLFSYSNSSLSRECWLFVPKSAIIVVILNTLPKCIQKKALHFVTLLEGPETFIWTISISVLGIALGNCCCTVP